MSSAQDANQTVLTLLLDGWTAMMNSPKPPPGIADVDNPVATAQAEQAKLPRKADLLNVYIQGSSIAHVMELKAFLEKQHRICVSGCALGSVAKSDVQKAAIITTAEFACLLALDVTVHRKVKRFANQVKVKVIKSSNLKELEDSFISYRDELITQRRIETRWLATFPCSFSFTQVARATDPIIGVVKINIGILKLGAPVCIPSKQNMLIGYISHMERHKVDIESAATFEEAIVILQQIPGVRQFEVGVDFTGKEVFASRITKDSVEVCDFYYRKETRKHFLLTKLFMEDFGIV